MLASQQIPQTSPGCPAAPSPISSTGGADGSSGSATTTACSAPPGLTAPGLCVVSGIDDGKPIVADDIWEEVEPAPGEGEMLSGPDATEPWC